MPNHLSTIGIIHTAISVIGVFVAFYSLARYGKIDPDNKMGKWYIGLTLFACFSSFLVMKTGHLSGAHGLSILILTILPFSIYAKKIKVFGKRTEYIQVTLMSATLFFSLIPAVVETLTRLPVNNPLASPEHPTAIQVGLATLVTLFIAGIIYQIRKIRVGNQTRQIYDDLHLSNM